MSKPDDTLADLRDKLIVRVGVLHKSTPCEAITARLVVDTILPTIQQDSAKARLEELKSALYVYENQVPYQFALAGALGGVEKDLSEGILVEIDGSKRVVTGGVNFKLPHFFNDRISELEKELEKYE